MPDSKDPKNLVQLIEFALCRISSKETKREEEEEEEKKIACTYLKILGYFVLYYHYK